MNGNDEAAPRIALTPEQEIAYCESIIEHFEDSSDPTLRQWCAIALSNKRRLQLVLDQPEAGRATAGTPGARLETSDQPEIENRTEEPR